MHRQFLVSTLNVLGWIVVLFTLAIMGLLLTMTAALTRLR